MTRSGRSRDTPTLAASGSHQAPSPASTRPGARSSRVENSDASRAGLRVQMSMTPDPTAMRSVVAANAAMGTVASRTSRLSACHTAAKPRSSARDTNPMASRMGWASCT